MTTSSRARKKSSPEQLGEREPNRNVPGIDKLMAFAEELAATTEGVLRETASREEAVPAPRLAPVAPVRRFNAPQAAREAAAQLNEVTNLKVDTVSSVNKNDAGWQVVVNLVELERIPHSTDVIAPYEAQLDAEGNLEGYRRLGRYLRGQTGDES